MLTYGGTQWYLGDDFMPGKLHGTNEYLYVYSC